MQGLAKEGKVRAFRSSNLGVAEAAIPVVLEKVLAVDSGSGRLRAIRRGRDGGFVQLVALVCDSGTPRCWMAASRNDLRPAVGSTTRSSWGMRSSSRDTTFRVRPDNSSQPRLGLASH